MVLSPIWGSIFNPMAPTPIQPICCHIKEAREAQEAAAEQLQEDLVFVGKKLNSIGCEGLNLDTCGSAGDADFLAALKAVGDLKKETPNMPLIMGASGEFVIGMHGELRFHNKQIAGMYPHEQAKAAEAAGVHIFGVAIGTNTTKSVVWNIARTVTFVKATGESVNMPIHVNVGMGVGGVPMLEAPPIDSVTRASKSLVQIGKADGL